MTTAAEALEKLIRLERDLEKKCHDLGYYNMIHVGLREFVEHAAAFRAALAQPQEGEVEPRKVMQTEFGVDGNCQSACIATITGIPLDAIPNFTKLGKTDLQRRQAMCEWLWAHGWGIVTFVASDTEIRRWYRRSQRRRHGVRWTAGLGAEDEHAIYCASSARDMGACQPHAD